MKKKKIVKLVFKIIAAQKKKEDEAFKAASELAVANYFFRNTQTKS